MKRKKTREESGAEQKMTAKKTRRIPLWAVIALSAAWILLALLALAALIWQIGENRDRQRERTGEFLYGEVVDTSVSVYTYEEMETDLRELCRAYPDLIRVASAGKTADGREILYADLGNKNAKRQIFLSAGIHGREHMNTMLAMKMIEYFLLNYNIPNEDGVTFREATGAYMIRVVPMANPDGVTVSQKGIEGIRSEELRAKIESIFQVDYNEYQSYRDSYANREEYLKHWKANAEGVDLNRNFPIDEWGKMTTGIGHPSSQKYKGPSGGSAIETKTLMRLLEELSNPLCVVSLHSQGEILYWDCGQEGELRQKNERLVRALAELTGYEIIKTFTSPDATLEDWAALKKGIPSVNIETGKGSCPLPLEQFEKIWSQTEDLLLVLAEFGG